MVERQLCSAFPFLAFMNRVFSNVLRCIPYFQPQAAACDFLFCKNDEGGDLFASIIIFLILKND